MRNIRPLLAVNLVLAIGAVCAAGQQLQPYSSTDGRFSVSFPKGEIKTNTDPIPFKDGTKGTMYEFTVELDGGNVAYIVMYNDYPPDKANDGSDAVLARTRDGAVGSKTLVSDMAINLNGVPGREFTTKDDKWNYTVRQFLKGYRLYQLIVVCDSDHPATQTSEFMDSFKIN
ncbi:MAG TPA: hypothetical protein VL986_07765 [Terracidiphilus sp.]|nr:hypothetical protein [Terracidiphilus sp.]